jgi:flavodoxin
MENTMKVLIVYASWFGHNRAIAQQIAAELTQRGLGVTCTPVSRVSRFNLAEYDLLVLGTYTHAGRASRRLRALCAAIPQRRFDHLAVALFGTQISQPQQAAGSSGVDDLEACLLQRGCEPALAPLHIELSAGAAFSWRHRLEQAALRRVSEFAADLWDAGVPEPLI